MKIYYSLILAPCLLATCAEAAINPAEPSETQEVMQYYSFSGHGGFIFLNSKDLLQYLKTNRRDENQGTYYLLEAFRAGRLMHVSSIQPLNIIAIKESSIATIAKIKIRYNGMDIIGYTRENTLKKFLLNEIISTTKKDIEKDERASGNW